MKKSALTDRTIGIKEEFIAKMLGKMPDPTFQIHKSKIQVSKEGDFSLSYVEDLDENRRLLRYDPKTGHSRLTLIA